MFVKWSCGCIGLVSKHGQYVILKCDEATDLTMSHAGNVVLAPDEFRPLTAEEESRIIPIIRTRFEEATLYQKIESVFDLVHRRMNR